MSALGASEATVFSHPWCRPVRRANWPAAGHRALCSHALDAHRSVAPMSRLCCACASGGLCALRRAQSHCA
eukprot:9187510-Alexandrium_andersonii.AAC.1